MYKCYRDCACEHMEFANVFCADLLSIELELVEQFMVQG